MNRKIVIASHGRFADGIYDSLKMIIGENASVIPFSAYIDQEVDYGQRVFELLSNHNYSEKQLIVLTDLYGGSINNEFMRYIHDYPFFLISGLNLGLLITLVLDNREMTRDSIIDIINESQKYIKLCNEIEMTEEETF